MKKLFILAASLAAAAGSAVATDQGVPTSGNSFAFWDTFSSGNFTLALPNSSDTSLFSATLDIASGGFPTGSGDRLYDGGAGVDFTVNGTATGTISTFVLQLKTTGLATDYSFLLDTSEPGEISPDTNGTLVGVGQSINGSGGPQALNIYQWTWTGLSLAATDTFTVTGTGAGAHASADGLRISDTAAASIPEPSVSAMALVGVGGLLLGRRARNSFL